MPLKNKRFINAKEMGGWRDEALTNKVEGRRGRRKRGGRGICRHPGDV